MLTATIDYRRYCPVIEVVQPRSEQLKAMRSEVNDRGRKRELVAQPGFERMRIWGGDVCEMIDLQGTHMRGDYLPYQPVCEGRGRPVEPHEHAPQHQHEEP